MTFDIHGLDNLNYEDVEDVEEVLYDYIEGAIEQFERSPEGQAYATEYPETGRWISSFIELGYSYEGRSLPTMTKETVKLMMESLLPRKITVMEAAEAEAAIPELAAFWAFLSQEYQLSNAKAIRAYLLGIQDQFGEWMVDPARGGIAKNFILSGMKAGFDMSSQAGMEAYQQAYNAQLLAGQGEGLPLRQKIATLFGAATDNAPPALPKKQSAQKSKAKNKGFGDAVKSKAARRKKK